MLIAYCDGLCEPINPGGTATYGWVLYKDREKIAEGCRVVCSGPKATNNVAEYSAVIAVLEYLIKNNLTEEKVIIRSDSQLCIYQLQGRYRVSAPRIIPKYKKAKSLAKKFKEIKFEWVPRSQNEEADALSRKAYNQHLKKLANTKQNKAQKLVSLVREAGEGIYEVPSMSEPGKYHTVDYFAGRCTCPASRRCSHLLAVELYLKGEKNLAFSERRNL